MDAIYLSNHGYVPVLLSSAEPLSSPKDPKECDCGRRWLRVVLIRLDFRGRALDTAPPALYTLLEINKYCPEILKRCEVSNLPAPAD